MVMEYCAGGELLDAICTLDHYTEDHVRSVMLQVTALPGLSLASRA